MIKFVNVERYKTHLKEDLLQKKLVGHSNQFEVEINMVEPTTKKPLPIEIFTSFSVNNATPTSEPIPIGTKQINNIVGATQKTVTIGLLNQLEANRYVQYLYKSVKHQEVEEHYYSDGDVVERSREITSSSNPSPIKEIREERISDKSTLDYFLKHDGVPILPTDGTILLEREFYFKIKGYALNKAWNKKEEVDGDFIISEVTAINYNVGEEANAEFEITFKEII